MGERKGKKGTEKRQWREWTRREKGIAERMGQSERERVD